ncbi:sulfatase family protein [Algisphaera agarilytica]|uniref:Arylsulfatase A-like enzyme n=1 Tax=Algisphaera agarilytica TaxID=1385975 RepID=A0A7X0HC44_9BACT|nr:sulfatase-like hydrolase/transferase [Algisphaera agarilytica]MBB6431694.1 arylsulfatase A-like enzyme [Algisphaera agarilytica]
MSVRRWLAVLGCVLMAAAASGENAQRPNIVLIMADDLGYGDTGFNGNTLIQTPHLDALAAEGVTLTHFYSGNSVCSPTRATALTGRHHDRMGIWNANVGHLPKQEVTLAQILKAKGYATGHFGKWHLGTLSRTMSSKGERRKPALNYAPPWERDYDASFVTESAVQLWDPGLGKRSTNNPFFENGVALDGDDPSLRGGASRVVVDRMVPFVETSVEADTPFFAVCWFHAPHTDVIAGPEYLAMYPRHGEAAHYYGCVTEMDDQVGRIVKLLKDRGVFDSTLIFFCSDNGPEGKQPGGRNMGETAGYRGRKRALYDGGVRVPAFAVWPGMIESGTKSDAVLSTLDYFPTVQNIVGYTMSDDRPLDGEDVLDILTGDRDQRTTPLVFRYRGKFSSWIDGPYKLVMPAGELYDMENDPFETTDVSAEMPKKTEAMTQALAERFESIRASHAGADYGDAGFEPVDPWRPLQLQPKESP